MFLISHPKHGRMHVYTLHDLAQHKDKGWSAVEENKPLDEGIKPLSEPKKTLHLPKKAKR